MPEVMWSALGSDDDAVLADGLQVASARPRALVVDDDPVNLMLARMQFERLGADVTVVGDAESAWHLLCRHDFDVAYVDVQMPGMSGLELASLMTLLGDRRPLTAITTASAVAADHASALAAGADMFVAKPAGLAELRGVLDAWARR